MHKMYATVASSNSSYTILFVCRQIVCCFYIAVNRKWL